MPVAYWCLLTQSGMLQCKHDVIMTTTTLLFISNIPSNWQIDKKHQYMTDMHCLVSVNSGRLAVHILTWVLTLPQSTLQMASSGSHNQIVLGLWLKQVRCKSSYYYVIFGGDL